MKTILFSILLASTLVFDKSYAQERTIKFGFSPSMAAKINTVKNVNIAQTALGAIGFDWFVRVYPMYETGLIFQGNAGVNLDRITHLTLNGNKLSEEIFSVTINPTVMVNTKWERIKGNMGVGVQWNVNSDLVHSSNNTNSYGINLQNIYDHLDSMRRKIIPLVSMGIDYQINRHFEVGINIRQALLNYYPHSTYFTYYDNQQVMTKKADYFPTFIAIKANYLF